ncbi:MAG: hypothetical protein KY475_13695, partial [Planctomycetes bacterium]|nr:hypothetical protein [Planctomycetota bacterium]
VFGYLVEGHDVREAISNTATGEQDRPTNTIRMDNVEIFMDEENGVLRMKAAPGTTGTATVTVTATDVEGRSTQRTFNVTVEADAFNGGPFLSDIPPITTAMNTPVTFQLEGNDVEGDAMRFTATLPQGANPTFNFNIDENTGEVTVTPPPNFEGTLELLVGVRPQTTSDTADPLDVATVTINVTPLGLGPRRISGLVYLDDDDDGIAEPGEGRLGGVRIILTGTTAAGAVIAPRETLTGPDGVYAFHNLPNGVYVVREVQPGILLDGRESPGSALAAVSGNDEFTITLVPGASAIGNNFAEVRPPVSFSVFDFLHPDTPSIVVAADVDGTRWYVIENGWPDVRDVEVRLHGDGTLTATIETAVGVLHAPRIATFETLAHAGGVTLLRLVRERIAFTQLPAGEGEEDLASPHAIDAVMAEWPPQ